MSDSAFGNFDLSAMADQAVNEAMGQAFDATLGDWFDDKVKADPEEALAFLDKYKIEAASCITATGEIDLEAFKKKLTATQKLSFLMGGVLIDFIGEQIDKVVPDLNVKLGTFEEKMAEITAMNSKVQVVDKNIIYPAGGPMDLAASVYRLLGGFSDITTEGLEGFFKGFPIAPGSVAVLPPLLANGALKYPVLQKLFAKVEVTVKRLTPPQTIAKPGDKEICYVSAPATGLPVSAGNVVDKRQMEWYKNLYEMGVTSWLITPVLLAGISMMRGVTQQDALAAAGVAGDANIAAQFASLESQIRPAVVTTTTTTTTATAPATAPTIAPSTNPA